MITKTQSTNADSKRTYTVEEIENKFPKNCVCIIDALFGTGLNKPLEGNFLAAVNLINRTGVYTVAVDLPSGIPLRRWE